MWVINIYVHAYIGIKCIKNDSQYLFVLRKNYDNKNNTKISILFYQNIFFGDVMSSMETGQYEAMKHSDNPWFFIFGAISLWVHPAPQLWTRITPTLCRSPGEGSPFHKFISYLWESVALLHFNNEFMCSMPFLYYFQAQVFTSTWVTPTQITLQSNFFSRRS